MSEMLGNQYFLARKYANAIDVFEKALTNDFKNKGIRCKLIICYTQAREIKKALDVFVTLIEDDIEFIINMDPVRDDCPCPELVFDLEANLDISLYSFDYYLSLGMLWLYCDLKKSIEYFRKAQKLDQENPKIKYILFHLISTLKKKENS